MNNSFISRDERWLLPEGIEELLPDQAECLERLRRRLLDLYTTWGYRLVITPIVEYLESLLIGTGHDLELQTFKLTDQLTGRLLGVRADITPQVARVDAHRLKSKAPTRLCYIGQVLHTYPEGFTRNRSPFQVGAELYGHAGTEADVEILQLMVATLKAVGLMRPHVDIGHVGIFRGLAKEAGINDEQERILFCALQRKMKPEMISYLNDLDIDDKYRHMFVALVELWGGEEVLQEARRALQDAGVQVQQALANLEDIATLAQRRMPDMHLHFDLADLRGYHYQTGLTFAVFMAGHGEEIARGGRYDDIGRVFGVARPATGFSTNLETLLMLSTERGEPIGGIYAPAEENADLYAVITELRRKGERVCMGLCGQEGEARAMGCDRMLVRNTENWTVIDVDN